MTQGKIILNIKAAAKYYDPTASGALSGGASVTMPDGTALTVGGCKDTAGNYHTLEVWQAVTCEDDGTGTGNVKEYCRLILMSDRFAKPTGW